LVELEYDQVQEDGEERMSPGIAAVVRNDGIPGLHQRLKSFGLESALDSKL
jgi:hypothetical protein